MRKIVVGFICIIALWFLADRIGGLVMWQVNQHSRDMVSPTIRHLAHEADEDIILLGTSRCNGHYVPSIIRDSLKMSVFNGGVDGSHDIYAHYICLKLLLAHHSPKIICLELSDGDFRTEEDPFYSVSYFAPYFGRYPEADEVFTLSGKANLYRLSHLYRYNAKAISNITGLVKRRWDQAENGYLPIDRPTHFPDSLLPHRPVVRIDSCKCAYIEKFIQRCQEQNIQLVFTISPYYTLVDSTHYDILKDLANRHHVPVFDYHSSGLFHDHPEYFHDEQHLWDRSARIYSTFFAKDLKQLCY
jgi:hypothetical protein